MPDRELALLRFVGHRLPPLPHASGIANRILKPLYLRKPRAPVVCDVLGAAMELDPTEAVDGNLMLCPQLYDRKEITYLLDHLSGADTFVDVGAHVGFYTLMAARRITSAGGGGAIVAIEPAPNTFETLTRNIGLNAARVTALRAGVSDRVETLELYLQERGNRGGNSFLNRDGGAHTVSVTCYPLIDILQQVGLRSVTGLKIDVEGFEYRILKHFLEHAPSSLYPRFIITEFYPERVAESTGDQIALLTGRGYREVLRNGNNRILRWER